MKNRYKILRVSIGYRWYYAIKDLIMKKVLPAKYGQYYKEDAQRDIEAMNIQNNLIRSESLHSLLMEKNCRDKCLYGKSLCPFEKRCHFLAENIKKLRNEK